MQFDQSGDAVRQLFDLITALRGPDGCPWDRAQKFEDVLSDLVEEAYELQWAGSHHGPADVLDEMGDVFFLVCFAIAIRRERDPEFNLDRIAAHAWKKIHSRHPHVFGDAEASTPRESIEHWERAKALEREKRDAGAGALAGVAGNLPPLRHAEKIQERAAAVGFDWDRIEDVFAKVREEIDELEEALASGKSGEIHHEIGDALFSLVNVARYLSHDPDRALNDTTSRFIGRFETMEKMISDEGKRFADLSLAEMDVYWERVKSGL